MVGVKHEPDSEDFSRMHVLYVEGNSAEAIDPTVIGILLAGLPLRIQALGPSSHIRSVADALHGNHRKYYYLVDRDHHDAQTVEACWQNFACKDAPHLLIWRRRELENYFLIPEYICKSTYLKCTVAELQDQIIQEARQRILLDAANLVLVGLREELKKNWIETFPKTQDFDTREHALEQLLNHVQIPQKIASVSCQLHENEVTRRFHEVVDDLFGGQKTLKYAHGSWLERVSGKALLNVIVNKCYKVETEKGTLQGEDARKIFIKELLRLPLSEQPNDFQELHRLISTVIKNTA